VELPAVGVVIAAVELVAPVAPWPTPPRIVLVELEESVRVLALCPGGLPTLGDHVAVARDGDRFVVRTT